MAFIRPVVALLAAYLLGSLPFALWITRWRTGEDLREHGSGHAGATNTMRLAGWPAGLAVVALDIGKGFAAVWLTVWLAGSWWAPPAAGLAVAGHLWPLFAGFRGGVGAAAAAGAMLAAWPPGAVLALGTEVALQLLLRHTARANVLTGLVLGPLWWLAGAPLWAVGVAAVAGALVAYRSLGDWGRVYRELWLDREPPAGSG